MTTAPIELAYLNLQLAITDRLIAAGFIGQAVELQVDPVSPFEPTGEETAVQTAASVFKLAVTVVRELMGGGPNHRRFVVERQVRLELALCGQVVAGDPSHDVRLQQVEDLLASLSEEDPTLGQTCERLELTGSAPEDLPPNGLILVLTWTIRLRSGDRLGRTCP